MTQDYSLLLGLIHIYKETDNLVKPSSRSELHSLMLQSVERIQTVLTAYDPNEAITLINIVAELEQTVEFGNKSKASSRSGLDVLFTVLGYNRNAIKSEQNTALSVQTFDAAHTFLTVVDSFFI